MLAVVHIVDQICGLTAFGRLWRSKADHNFRHPTEGAFHGIVYGRWGKAFMKKLSLLGSTGSIGTQALDVVRGLSRGGFPVQVEVLAARSNIRLLEEQIRDSVQPPPLYMTLLPPRNAGPHPGPAGSRYWKV